MSGKELTVDFALEKLQSEIFTRALSKIPLTPH